MNFQQNSDTFNSFAWPEEFPTNPSVARYDNVGKIEKMEKNDNDHQLEQKLDSLCRRSFLKAATSEERNFLARVCDDGEENEGNEIVSDEESSSNHQTGDNLIRKLPRLSSGYGHHLGKV